MWQKIDFERLRMLPAVALAATGGGADDQRHFRLRATHIVPLGGLIADLVRRHQREVEIHQLHHRPQAPHRRAAGRAADAGFADRRVEDAMATERLEQALRHLERAAIVGHVLAIEDDAIVARHFFGERFAQRVLVSDFAVDALRFGRRRVDLDLGELRAGPSRSSYQCT